MGEYVAGGFNLRLINSHKMESRHLEISSQHIAPCLVPMEEMEEALAAKCAEPEVRAYREMIRPRTGPETESGVRCSITWLPSYTWNRKPDDMDLWTFFRNELFQY